MNRDVVASLALQQYADKIGSYSIYQDWIIHRGYIYYYYAFGGTSTEDSFYLNGSHYIYRKSLSGGEIEPIMKMDLSEGAESCLMRGYGSYVYFNIPQAGKQGGILYRYNTESDEVECLLDIGSDICDYSIHDGKLYYQTESECNVIYEYDFENGSNQCFLNANQTYGNCYARFFADNDSIYLYHKPNENTFDKIYEVYTWEKEFITTFFGCCCGFVRRTKKRTLGICFCDQKWKMPTFI